MENAVYTVVIGAGHAGLCTSQVLEAAGVDHVVLERGRVGETWQAQRWDRFRMNTPNELNDLPDSEHPSDDANGFGGADEFARSLRRHVETFDLPVREQTPVLSVERDDAGFLVKTPDATWRASKVVVASGALNVPQIPSLRDDLPSAITQLHSSAYRSPDALPEGAVLVVGSGQSGAQISEELARSGRKVFLCTSKVARAVRNYRGKDLIQWMMQLGLGRMTVADLPDPAMQYARQPLIGAGHTLSLQHLGRLGVTLLGRLESIHGSRLAIADDLAGNAAFADASSTQLKTMVDAIIAARELDAEPATPDPAEAPFAPIVDMAAIREIDLARDGITSVIWATGYTGDFSYLKFDIELDAHGLPAHVEGVSPVPGLYFVGLPWQRTRVSGLIVGGCVDAAHIGEQLIAAS